MYVICMGEMEMHTEICVGKVKELSHLEHLDVAEWG
jgi:hypothetical protein